VNIEEATQSYEAWLKSTTPLNQRHLELKHELMKKEPFSFLRATFYRWIQTWPEVCDDLLDAPAVLSVGDLHIENFGTWRDSEGRLVWGVNDFDEAFSLPYTNDLVRLAASAALANSENQIALKPKEVCEAILSGYAEALEDGGEPLVLEEKHNRLRAMAFASSRNPRRFWKNLLDQEKKTRGSIPDAVEGIFDEIMPKTELPYRLVARVSGLGSLGRFRVVAIADWSGGKIAREIKALAPSACAWAANHPTGKTRYQSVLDRAVRCHDPFLQLKGSWIARRLSPHCCRIPLDDLPQKRDEKRLLYSMGRETANIHLGSRDDLAAIRRDLKKRSSRWLHDASRAMVEATLDDWKDWKKS
jgi:uncharacterized protein (DUF2252 family)